MAKFLFIFAPLVLCTSCAPTLCSDTHSNFMQTVIQRAKSDPSTANEYFIQRIESGASVDQQAGYLYGMGVAHQAQGNVKEATNDYLSASVLGNQEAKCGLMELQKIENHNGND